MPEPPAPPGLPWSGDGYSRTPPPPPAVPDNSHPPSPPPPTIIIDLG